MPERACTIRLMLRQLWAVLLAIALVASAAHAADVAAGQRELPDPAYLLTPEDYLAHKPNELGRVPVLMYHNIVPNDFDTSASGQDAYMYRTYSQFWNDMVWLHAHNFHLIGLGDLVSGNIDIPVGKHPVVFTFDDGTSLHFSVIEEADGSITINPNSAVGLMEKFYQQHPDFGRGAHFAISPGNKFSWPDMQEDEYFQFKLEWLMANGYEVGNHTQSHPDLSQSNAEEFAWTVGKPVLWGDEVFGKDHPTNCMRILTLPFGIYPGPEVNPVAYGMLRDGFQYEGQPIRINAVVHLAGGSTNSPWSTEYDAFHITRLPVQDETMASLATAFTEGGNVYYTSDGIVNAVTVPWPLPDMLVGHLSRENVAQSGKQLVRYHPGNGSVFKAHTGTEPVWVRTA